MPPQDYPKRKVPPPPGYPKGKVPNPPDYPKKPVPPSPTSIEGRILEISRNKPAGFTMYIDGLDKPPKGYSVAYIDTQNCFGTEGLKKVLTHANTHSRVIGGWLFNGKKYFDSVRVYHTKKAAVEAAIREQQIGFYDLSGRYIQMMNDQGQLLEQYERMLMRWNQNRKDHGLMPFKLLKLPNENN